MTKALRAVILRLPEATIEKLDSLSHDLKMPSRSALLRRLIHRQIDYIETNELPLLREPGCARSLKSLGRGMKWKGPN